MKIAGYTKSGRVVNTDQPETDTKRSPKKDKLDRSNSQLRKATFLGLFFFFFCKVSVFFLGIPLFLFIYFFWGGAVLGLRFCARAFSSCRKGATLHLGARASHYRGLSLRSTSSRRAGSVAVAHRPSCSAACGILPDQGSNPCPLHWQADSQPLRHQGSPLGLF